MAALVSPSPTARSAMPPRAPVRSRREAQQVETHVGHHDEGHQAAGVAFDEGHGGGDQGGEGPQRRQDEADSVLGRSIERPGEDGFPRAGQAENAEFAHDSGEQHAHRCRRGAVGVGQPEVPRHHGRFDQECGGEKGEGHRQQAIGGPTGKGPPHLGQVEGAGAARRAGPPR